MKRVPAFGRLALVLVMSVSWFALANHCALAVAAEALDRPPESCCSRNKAAEKTPAQDDQQGDRECCQKVHATSAPVAKKQARLDSWSVPPGFFAAPVVFSNNEALVSPALELDTGPPFVRSFAEAVLQRSLLAHAPPPLA